MIAVMQAVFCGVWLLGSLVIGDIRRAALHWSAFAGLSSLSFVGLVIAPHQPAPLPAEHLRAMGNVCGVAAMIALHRGIRLFVGAPPSMTTYALAIAVVLVASWLELREVDALARFGGEEFLVLMPGATVDAATPVAERLRTALVTDAPRIDGVPLSLSASIGVAQWRAPAEEPSRLLMRADAALYHAKTGGRDRVVVEAPEGGTVTPRPELSTPGR